MYDSQSNANREIAKKSGAKRYFGIVCKKHPELSGERYVANYGCIACGREAAKKHAATPHGKKRIASYWKEPEKKEMRKVWKKKYYSTENGQLKVKQYRQTDKVKAYVFAKNNSPDRKAYMAEYRKQPKQKAVRKIWQRHREQHISCHAMPPWANRETMGKVYREAQKITDGTGRLHVVDHIVPIKHKLVCGLHVTDNLQILPWQANIRKSNHFHLGEA